MKVVDVIVSSIVVKGNNKWTEWRKRFNSVREANSFIKSNFSYDIEYGKTRVTRYDMPYADGERKDVYLDLQDFDY
jgi:hypothetical protein